jgi:hypothetical protein
MYFNRVPYRAITAMLRPVGWPLLLLTGLASLAAFYAESIPGGFFRLQLIPFCIWLLLGLY